MDPTDVEKQVSYNQLSGPFTENLQDFLGGVFTREDALVNDFWDEEKAEVTLTLSDNKTITRQRIKQDSTTKGAKPPSAFLSS